VTRFFLSFKPPSVYLKVRRMPLIDVGCELASFNEISKDAASVLPQERKYPGALFIGWNTSPHEHIPYGRAEIAPLRESSFSVLVWRYMPAVDMCHCEDKPSGEFPFQNE
jgi:hypothetical protein